LVWMNAIAKYINGHGEVARSLVRRARLSGTLSSLCLISLAGSFFSLEPQLQTKWTSWTARRCNDPTFTDSMTCVCLV
jgi:hypothetical protein